MDELEYCFRLLEEFFGQSIIQKGLKIIENHKISGWEKWWQIELAMFLSEDEDIAEWDMEVPFSTDLRKNQKKDFISIDIAFRPKKLSRDKFIFLELKQNDDYVKCLRNMLLDSEKVFGSHSKSVDGIEIRSFFVVGVYLSVEKKEIINCLMEIHKDYNIELEKDEIRTKFIPNTNYSFTIF